jgi:hypothetical protein
VLDAFAKRAQLAVFRQAALGKYADGFAVIESLGNPIHRCSQDLGVLIPPRDWDDAGPAQELADDGQLAEFVIHDEAHRPR